MYNELNYPYLVTQIIFIYNIVKTNFLILFKFTNLNKFKFYYSSNWENDQL